MSKRVILIGSAFPFRGGLASYNERLAKEFTNQGYDIEIYNFKLQYPGIFFPGKTQYTEGEAPRGIQIRNKVHSLNPFNWLKIGNEIRKKEPDLVIVKYWMPFFAPCFGTILRMVKKNNRTKVVSIIDNLIPHEQRPGDKLLTKYFIHPVDGFISMSSTVSEDIRNMTNKPMEFCPHPLFDDFGTMGNKEEAKRKLGLNPECDYILFFGLVRKYKGLDLLLKSMNHPEIRKLPLKLVVAGEFYDNKEAYLKLVDDQQPENNVLIEDRFIPTAEVDDPRTACPTSVRST